MGAIASSGHPDALKLFREVLLASAAIPVAFPPVYVRVEAKGEIYDEMHVDGGTTQQLFFYGELFDVPAIREAVQAWKEGRSRLYVIRNSKVDPVYKAIEPELFQIAGGMISTLIRSQAEGDLLTIYTACQRDGTDFLLAHIPREWDPGDAEEFDTEKMNRLFDLAFEQARKGYPWKDRPPARIPEGDGE
jgi:hypothetical protein